MLAFSDLYEEKKYQKYGILAQIQLLLQQWKQSPTKEKKIIHNQECVCVYIYIYMGLVQVLLGETLNNVTPINIFNWI